MDIHKAGGGIMFTVEHTRHASEDRLYELFKDRMQKLLQAGMVVVMYHLIRTSCLTIQRIQPRKYFVSRLWIFLPLLCHRGVFSPKSPHGKPYIWKTHPIHIYTLLV